MILHWQQRLTGFVIDSCTVQVESHKPHHDSSRLAVPTPTAAISKIHQPMPGYSQCKQASVGGGQQRMRRQPNPRSTRPNSSTSEKHGTPNRPTSDRPMLLYTSCSRRQHWLQQQRLRLQALAARPLSRQQRPMRPAQHKAQHSTGRVSQQPAGKALHSVSRRYPCCTA